MNRLGAPLSSLNNARGFRSSVAKAIPAIAIKRTIPSITSLQSRSLSSKAETLEFQAETRKLLDIVTNSIYTDKEVFIRELISNASDALEKYRYNSNKGTVLANASNTPPEISIEADPRTNTLTICDTGIGMSREELVSNLGTIARSGSKSFVEEVKQTTGSASDTIIGQFGVGFYASFMVADRVSVDSVSALTEHNKDNTAHRWASEGYGTFSIEEIDTPLSMPHGTKITLHLKEACKEFAEPDRIKSIIQRYSNFVTFPIKINGQAVNTVQAIWTSTPSSVKDEDYQQFYQHIAQTKDPYKYKLHYKTDAPIDLKCLFYVPVFHTEKYGMGRMEPGVNLFSRKVLIESKPKDLLPEWLRFVKGVVDSEDLPLSLSREKPQDSNLLRRIRDVLVRKLLRFFADEQKAHPEKYREFYQEYHMFIKEGLCADHKYMELLSKLLLFESSSRNEGELLTLDDYLAACPPEQKEIYYLIAPTRQAALSSPYLEYFKKHNRDVLLLYNTIDDFVMLNLGEYAGRKVVSAETSSIDFSEKKEGDEKTNKADESSEGPKLSDEQGKKVCEYLQEVLGSKKVRSVKVSQRLSGSPAIVTDHESGAVRRMMRMVEQANAGKGLAQDTLPPQQLEINPEHPLIVQLFETREVDQETAKLVAEQIFDNALLVAGLVDDPRYMIPRLQDLLLKTLRR